MTARYLEIDQFIVLCRTDREPDGTPGKYVVVGTPHDTYEDARAPVVVQVVSKTDPEE